MASETLSHEMTLDDFAALTAERDSLRATLVEIEGMMANCAGIPANPDSLPQMVLYEVRKALALSPEGESAAKRGRTEGLEEATRVLALIDQEPKP